MKKYFVLLMIATWAATGCQSTNKGANTSTVASRSYAKNAGPQYPPAPDTMNYPPSEIQAMPNPPNQP